MKRARHITRVFASSRTKSGITDVLYLSDGSQTGLRQVLREKVIFLQFQTVWTSFQCGVVLRAAVMVIALALAGFAFVSGDSDTDATINDFLA